MNQAMEPTALRVVVDGLPCLTIDGVAVLLGVECVSVESNGWDQIDNLPHHLMQRLVQRMQEADAHNGVEDPAQRLTYWAARDRGATTVTDDEGNLFMVG